MRKRQHPRLSLARRLTAARTRDNMAPTSEGLDLCLGGTCMRTAFHMLRALSAPIICTLALLATPVGAAGVGRADLQAQEFGAQATERSSAPGGIVRLEISRVESPTFEGQSFGTVGQYEKLAGRAYGEVDPGDPRNAVITDVGLAPRNAAGMV